MNDKTKFKIFIGLLVGILIGAALLLAKLILTKETGEFSPVMAIAITGGMILGASSSYLLSIRKKKKNNNIPEVDERTVLVLKNYFLSAFYLVMMGTGLICLVLYLMDITTIELGMIFVYLTFVFIIVAIGALIAKRKG